jgi:hypothetical protein
MLELMRLDQLLKAIYTNAKNGDIAAIDRRLAISMRRARLLGLDRQRSVGRFGSDEDPDAPRVAKVEIVGDPEVERIRWLEERVRFLEAGDTADADADITQSRHSDRMRRGDRPIRRIAGTARLFPAPKPANPPVVRGHRIRRRGAG